MDFFTQAVSVIQTILFLIGAGLGIWGVVNLLEGTAMTTVRHVRS